MEKPDSSMISLIWHVVVFNSMLTPLKVYPQEAAYDSDTHTPALFKMSHTHTIFNTKWQHSWLCFLYFQMLIFNKLDNN